jgi:hypothetical protein
MLSRRPRRVKANRRHWQRWGARPFRGLSPRASFCRVRAALAKVQTRVTKGQLKKPEKIGAAVERALQNNHGYRYYTWALKEGRLEIVEHPVNLPRERKYEGKYLIQTDQVAMTPQERWSTTKN